MSMDDRFSIAPVNSIVRAMDMRWVRNQVSPFMTHNRDRISILQQIAWYFLHYRKSNSRAYLVFNDKGEPIGYGLVSQRGEFWTVTGALIEDYRGMGIGRILFRFLTQDALLSSGKDVYLDVLASNIPAQKLYLSLGYKPVFTDADNGIIGMKWSGELINGD